VLVGCLYPFLWPETTEVKTGRAVFDRFCENLQLRVASDC